MEQITAFQNQLKKDACMFLDVLYSEDQGLQFTCKGGHYCHILSGLQNVKSLQKLILGFKVRVDFRLTFYVRVRAKVSKPVLRGAQKNPKKPATSCRVAFTKDIGITGESSFLHDRKEDPDRCGSCRTASDLPGAGESIMSMRVRTTYNCIFGHVCVCVFVKERGRERERERERM